MRCADDDTPSSVPVVIVGGGPTGIVAATLLARYGVESVVLERWADIYPQPRAVAADGEVFRILAQIGIGDEFSALSRPGLGLRLMDPELTVMSEFRRNSTLGVNGFPESNMFDQPELERALRANLATYPEAHFRRNAEVSGVTQLPGGRLRVRFADRESGEMSTVDGEYVFGCDGANSLTRRSIGATMTDLHFEQRWLVIDIDTDADLKQWDGVHQVCSSVRAGTFMRVGDTRYRWEFQLLPDETGDDYQTLSDISPLISPWLFSGALDRMTLIRLCEYTFRAQVADRWRHGNVFLLGDAAHLTPPFIGQGMGAGLRDAMNLAWKVAGVLDGTLPTSALDSYPQERKPHARSMIRFAVAIGWAMTAGGWAGDVVRRHLLPALQPLAAAADPTASPALHRSSLVRRRRRPRDLTGTLCPNVVLDGGRFDDIVGRHVAVVIRTAIDVRHRARLTDRGVVVVEVTPDSELGGWLRNGHAYAVAVRPDRTVLSSARAMSEVDETLAAAMAIARHSTAETVRSPDERP